jgi:hypothetical protein
MSDNMVWQSVLTQCGRRAKETNMLVGETILSGAPRQCECGHVFELEVLHSGAGFYIGTTCHGHGCFEAGVPNSRESVEYFPLEEQAAFVLNCGTWTVRGLGLSYEEVCQQLEHDDQETFPALLPVSWCAACGLVLATHPEGYCHGCFTTIMGNEQPQP